MIFNFFTGNGLDDAFRQHFNIKSRSELSLAISSYDYCYEHPIEFVKRLNLDLTANTQNCLVICRHITTCSDSLESIMDNGLIPLTDMLTRDTPLKNFLKKYTISINAANKILFYDNKEIPIVHFDMPCSICIQGKTKPCSRFFCDFHNELAMLHSKLYHDRGEVEAFLSGDDKHLHNYRSIQQAPEILWNFGKILKCLNAISNEYQLVEQWANQEHMKRYILNVTVPLNYLDMNIEYKRHADFYDNIEWFDYCNYTYDDYISGNIPLDFYRNCKLIKLYIEFHNDDYCDGYAQFLPQYHITPDMISIYRREEIRDY